MSHVMTTETRGDILARTLDELGVPKIELARRLTKRGGKVENKRRQVTDWTTPGNNFSDATAERVAHALQIDAERFRVARRRARRARLEDQVGAIRHVVVELAQREGVDVPPILLGDDE